MKAPRSGSLGAQEILSFDGPLTVDFHTYTEKDAREASKHRAERVGELALTPMTRGFQSRVGGLWVPNSGTENSIVVEGVDMHIRKSQHSALERYEGHMPGAVRGSISRAVANKVEEWKQDAGRKSFNMEKGIGVRGEVIRQQIEVNPIVINGIKSYLADLKFYIGHEDRLTKTGKRQAIQKNWANVLSAHDQWASQYLGSLPDWDFEKTCIEAYYNHRSRYQYWTDVIKRNPILARDIWLYKALKDEQDYKEGKGQYQ